MKLALIDLCINGNEDLVEMAGSVGSTISAQVACILRRFEGVSIQLNRKALPLQVIVMDDDVVVYPSKGGRIGFVADVVRMSDGSATHYLIIHRDPEP